MFRCKLAQNLCYNNFVSLIKNFKTLCFFLSSFSGHIFGWDIFLFSPEVAQTNMKTLRDFAQSHRRPAGGAVVSCITLNAQLHLHDLFLIDSVCLVPVESCFRPSLIHVWPTLRSKLVLVQPWINFSLIHVLPMFGPNFVLVQNWFSPALD